MTENIRQKLLEIGKLLLQKNKIKNAGNDIKRAYIFNKTRFRFPKAKIVLPLPAPQYLHFEMLFSTSDANILYILRCVNDGEELS